MRLKCLFPLIVFGLMISSVDATQWTLIAKMNLGIKTTDVPVPIEGDGAKEGATKSDSKTEGPSQKEEDEGSVLLDKDDGVEAGDKGCCFNCRVCCTGCMSGAVQAIKSAITPQCMAQVCLGCISAGVKLAPIIIPLIVALDFKGDPTNAHLDLADADVTTEDGTPVNIYAPMHVTVSEGVPKIRFEKPTFEIEMNHQTYVVQLKDDLVTEGEAYTLDQSTSTKRARGSKRKSKKVSSQAYTNMGINRRPGAKSIHAILAGEMRRPRNLCCGFSLGLTKKEGNVGVVIGDWSLISNGNDGDHDKLRDQIMSEENDVTQSGMTDDENKNPKRKGDLNKSKGIYLDDENSSDSDKDQQPYSSIGKGKGKGKRNK